MNRITKIGLAFGVAQLALAAPAHATITIYNVAGAVQPIENVLLPGGQTGLTVLGATNNTNTSVTFNSLNTDVLTTPANGAARIETTESTSSLSGLEFYLTNPMLSFTEFEFNLSNVVGRQVESVTLYYGGSATGSATYNTISNGSNWLAGEALNGDYFTSIKFNITGAGVNDIRQVRIGGIANVPAAVPEPATWAMMLAGFGLMGAGMRRRKAETRVRFAI